MCLTVWHHDVGEDSQTDSGSGEPETQAQGVLPGLENNTAKCQTSGTPHKLGHVAAPPLVVDDVSPGSVVGDDIEEGNEPVVDQEMMRLELQLDSWTLELKRNILVCDFQMLILVHTLAMHLSIHHDIVLQGCTPQYIWYSITEMHLLILYGKVHL
jgi:hypothetical protein